MSKSHKRKTTIGGWSEQSFKAAVKSVLNKKLSARKATESFNIPLSILRKRIKSNLFEPPNLGCTYPYFCTPFL